MLIETSLILANFHRANLRWGVSDYTVQIVVHVLQKSVLTAFCIMPWTSIMMKVIPNNIEASMYAVVCAAILLPFTWGGEFMGAIMIDVFNITTEDKSNFGVALEYRMITILIAMGFTVFLPRNQDI